MSYTGRNTTLIARSGYSGMGDVNPRDGLGPAAQYCARYSGDDNNKCFAWYTSNTPGDFVPASASGSGGGILDSIGKLLGGVGAGIVQSQFAPKQQPLIMPSRTPSWVMPVAIGGVALVAVLLLTKRRAPAAAPVSNPGRRRRRRRSRRR